MALSKTTSIAISTGFVVASYVVLTGVSIAMTDQWTPPEHKPVFIQPVRRGLLTDHHAMSTRLAILVLQNTSTIASLVILGHLLYRYLQGKKPLTTLTGVAYFHMAYADLAFNYISSLNSIYSADALSVNPLAMPCSAIGAITASTLVLQVFVSSAYAVLVVFERRYNKTYKIGLLNFGLIFGLMAAACISTIAWMPSKIYGNLDGLFCFIKPGTSTSIAASAGYGVLFILAMAILPATLLPRRHRSEGLLDEHRQNSNSLVVIAAPASTLQTKKNISRNLDDTLVLPEEVMHKASIKTADGWTIFSSRKPGDFNVYDDKETYTCIISNAEPSIPSKPVDKLENTRNTVAAVLNLLCYLPACVFFFYLTAGQQTPGAFAAVVVGLLNLSGLFRLVSYIFLV